MTGIQRTTAVGVFHNRTDAQQAVADLRRAGFRDDQIGVAARDDDGDVTFRDDADADEETSYAGEGALTGAAAGAGVGALWGLGIVAGLLPAIGPAIAGGTLAAILASAATGAAAAGLAGALIGLGISKEEAEYYEDELESGRVIVTVHADGRYDEAVNILRRFNSYDYSSAAERAERTTTGMVSGGDLDDTVDDVAPRPRTSFSEGDEGAPSMPPMHEEVRIRTPAGSENVRAGNDVRVEQRTLEVPVKSDEVIGERHPVGGQTAFGSGISAGSNVPMHEHEGLAHTEKPVAPEDVRIRKPTDPSGRKESQRDSGTDVGPGGACG